MIIRGPTRCLIRLARTLIAGCLSLVFWVFITRSAILLTPGTKTHRSSSGRKLILRPGLQRSLYQCSHYKSVGWFSRVCVSNFLCEIKHHHRGSQPFISFSHSGEVQQIRGKEKSVKNISRQFNCHFYLIRQRNSIIMKSLLFSPLDNNQNQTGMIRPSLSQ